MIHKKRKESNTELVMTNDHKCAENKQEINKYPSIQFDKNMQEMKDRVSALQQHLRRTMISHLF